MSDEERDLLILKLHANAELLKSVTAFLLSATIPRQAVIAYIEGLDIPAIGDTPQTTQIVHECLGAFTSQILKNLGTIEKNRG